MGISPLEYQRAIVNLEKVNKLIQEESKWGMNTLELVKPDEIFLSHKLKGRLEAQDMQRVTKKIFIPDGYKKVKFTGCRPRTEPITVLSCGVGYLGGNRKYESLAGSIFVNRSTEMKLNANNCGGEVSFQAADSNGGSANWELMR